MKWFGRKKSAQEPQVAVSKGVEVKREPRATASTFLEATGGGWSDAPDVIAINGGEDADYVGEMLSHARDFALANEIGIGERFEFTLTDIPVGITSPHEIIFGLMMRAHEVELSCEGTSDETICFIRMG